MRDLSDNSQGTNNETLVDFATWQTLGDPVVGLFDANGQELVVGDVDSYIQANQPWAVPLLGGM